MRADILVVDDNSDTLNTVSSVLGDSGYRVRLAQNGEEAERLCRDRQPDLILMDLLEAPEAGICIAERLRATNSDEVPIIAMSASNPMTARARAQACFAGWLPKPFTSSTLLHFVALADES